jgi:uncharacterized membrane protein
MSAKAGLSKTGVRLFGHPVHPILVHLPMGLLLTVPLWDLVGLVRPGAGSVAAAVADWTLVVGCLAGVAAAVAGVIDFAALPSDHPAGRAANLHLYLMLCALGFYGTSLLLRHGHAAARMAPQLLGLDAAGFLLLVAGGFFGAEMVYRHGVGQESAARESAATRPTGTGYHQGKSE